jgi:hypothetical protein
MTAFAKYRSKCAYCENWIEEDDVIEADPDGNWCHEECADEAKADAGIEHDDATPGNPGGRP